MAKGTTRLHIPLLDLNSKPLYPFGYDLSYTTFKFANLHVSKSSSKTGEAIELSVDVTMNRDVVTDRSWIVGHPSIISESRTSGGHLATQVARSDGRVTLR